jgi:hypothetical protein
VVRLTDKTKPGSERKAPTRFFVSAAVLLLAQSAFDSAAAQPRAAAPAQAAPAQPAAAAFDPTLVNKLVWSTMAAVDQANQTGNYSVLRDLGSPSFQAGNSAATLGGVFAELRAQQVDLSYALVLTPSYEFPPAINQQGLLRARGVFPLRPTAIGFDMLFQNVNGQWRIFGLAVIPLVARTQQSVSTKR